MIQGKLYGLYGSYGIHYMWDMALTCNGTLHCIALCMGTSYFMGVGPWLESNTTIGDLVGGLGTIVRSPIESHDCIKWKTCVG